jgi:hypothetical protein
MPAYTYNAGTGAFVYTYNSNEGTDPNVVTSAGATYKSPNDSPDPGEYDMGSQSQGNDADAVTNAQPPLNFADFIGQDSLKKSLRFFVERAKRSAERQPGETRLANRT